jgi:hypothetical protein
MFKFISGLATGWVAARSIPNKNDSPLKPPTYDELILLLQRGKEACEFISNKLETHEESSRENS